MMYQFRREGDVTWRSLVLGIVLVLSGCTGPTAPSVGSSFHATQISPSAGAVINVWTGVTISISGPLSVSSNRYYSLLFMRDDGVAYLATEQGPTTGQLTDDLYEFRQGVSLDAYLQARLFAGYCKGHNVAYAIVAITSQSLRASAAFDGGMVIASDKFDPQTTEYHTSVPLNYYCK